MNKRFSILELYKKSNDFLTKKGIESSKTDTEWILSKLLDVEKIDIYLDRKYIEEQFLINQIRQAILRRAKREPLQHILGTVEFYNCSIKSDSRALIPRFETELLVELIVKKLPNDFNGRILDLGTGSGAILVALAKEYPYAECVGMDKSANALTLAEENLALNQCSKNVTLSIFDWHSDVFSQKNFDVLVSNPPYLSFKEWMSCEPEVKEYDPQDALVSENDGLLDLETIIKISPEILKEGGLVALEFGYGQSEKLISVSKGFLNEISIANDLNGRRRFFFGRLIS